MAPRWSALLVACAVWALACPAGAAHADTDQWWYPQQIPAGADGSGVTLAVVDSAIHHPGLPVLADAQITIHPVSLCTDENYVPYPATGQALTAATFHGVNVVALIVGNGKGTDGNPSVLGIAPRTDLRFYSVNDPANDTRERACGSAIAGAIVQAVDDGARIISISQGSDPDPSLREAVAFALRAGTIIVAALGNTVEDSDWLAELNGVVAVQAVGRDGQLMGAGTPEGVTPHSKVTAIAPGVDFRLQGDRATHEWARTEVASGTSLATPVVAGMLAATASFWPDSTNAQLLHALINSGNAGGGEPTLDPVVGYGQVDLGRMLATDPTTFPDVHPLIVEEAGGLTAQDIANGLLGGQRYAL